MGTSASYSGPKGGNPLIPSWADLPLPGESPGELGAEPAEARPEADPRRDDAPPETVPDPLRLTPLRRAVRRSARAGGSDDGAMRAAARHFASSATGGGDRGARRMGSARRAGDRMVQAFSALATGGGQALARVLRLDSLAGLSTTQVWDRLAEFVCSDGASIDEAIVRVAFFQTLRLEIESGLDDLLQANPEQLSAFFERFIGECVLERLSQDGGSLLEQNGVSAAAAFTHLSTLRAFVVVQVRQRLSASQSRFLPGQIDAGRFDTIVSETLREAITAVGEWGAQG